MYCIITSITLFHWLMSLIWILLDRIYVKEELTKDNKEFKRCKFPISKNLWYIYLLKKKIIN